MTIYVFSGIYALVVIGAKTEERAREILTSTFNCNPGDYKLTGIYKEGEEFIESYIE